MFESETTTAAATPTVLQDAPDGALLQRYFVQGDTAAMDCFFARHTDAAYRVALSIAGNRADAEDVVQTAFLNVLSRGDGCWNSDTPNLRGWLMSIVVHAGLSNLRGDDARRRREEARGVDVSAQAAPDLEQAEVTAAALSIMRTLPMHYRLPLSLHLIEGLSIPETAGALTEPEPTVRKQLARGLALVREALATAGFACSAIALPEVIGGASRVGAPQSLHDSVKTLAGGAVGARSRPAGTARTAGAVRRLRFGVALAALGLFVAVICAAWAVRGSSTAAVRTQALPVQGRHSAEARGPVALSETDTVINRPATAAAPLAANAPAPVLAAAPGGKVAARLMAALLDEEGEALPFEVTQFALDYRDLKYWDAMPDEAKKWTTRDDQTHIDAHHSAEMNWFTTTVRAKNGIVAALKTFDAHEESGSFDYELTKNADASTATVWLISDTETPTFSYASRVREYALTLHPDLSVDTATMTHDWTRSGPPPSRFLIINNSGDIEVNDLPALTPKEKAECAQPPANTSKNEFPERFSGHHAPLELDALADGKTIALDADTTQKLGAVFAAARYVTQHQTISHEKTTPEERQKMRELILRSMKQMMKSVQPAPEGGTQTAKPDARTQPSEF